MLSEQTEIYRENLILMLNEYVDMLNIIMEDMDKNELDYLLTFNKREQAINILVLLESI